jgi:surface polysaccharide O-acyltransferase-like enzyme
MNGQIYLGTEAQRSPGQPDPALRGVTPKRAKKVFSKDFYYLKNFMVKKVKDFLEAAPVIPQKEKLDFIDLLKAIASFFVTIYHFNNIDVDILGTGGTFQYFNYYILSLLPISVPIFFLVNGALLLNKTTLDLRRHIIKIIDFVVLAVVWNVGTYLILALLFQEKVHFNGIFNSLLYLRQGWTNHLWFLQALVVIYIFFPLLYSAFKHNHAYLYFFFVIAFILTLGNIMITNIATVVSYFSNRFPRDMNLNYFGGFNAFQGVYGYSIVYFILGGVLIRYREHLKSKKLRIVAICIIPVAIMLQWLYAIVVSNREKAVWDVVWNGHDTLFTLMIVLSLFVLLLPYKHRGVPGQIISLIGQNTLGIYFLHIIVAEIIRHFFFNSLPPDFGSNALFALVVLAISLMITLGLKKIPGVRYLVSIR